MDIFPLTPRTAFTISSTACLCMVTGTTAAYVASLSLLALVHPISNTVHLFRPWKLASVYSPTTSRTSTCRSAWAKSFATSASGLKSASWTLQLEVSRGCAEGSLFYSIKSHRAWYLPSACSSSLVDSGFFSSDRTIRQYAHDIWHATPVPVKKEKQAE